MPALLFNRINAAKDRLFRGMSFRWLPSKERKRSYYLPRIRFQEGKKVVVQKTIYECNNHCIFCVVPDCFSGQKKERPAPGTTEFKQIIDSYHEDGRLPDTISFTSAEPTLRPDMIHLLEYTRERYPHSEIQLLTNGRMFRHQAYTRRFHDLLRHLELHIPLHGPNAEVHDGLTQVRGSFVQTVQGIHNIFRSAPDARMNIRILLHQQNCRYLQQSIDFITENFPQMNRIVLIYISMIGEAKKNSRELFLRLSDFKQILNGVLNDYAGSIPLSLFHVPFCILDEKFWDINAGRTLGDEQMEFPNACEGCRMRHRCCGFWKSPLNDEIFQDVSPIKTGLRI